MKELQFRIRDKNKKETIVMGYYSRRDKNFTISFSDEEFEQLLIDFKIKFTKEILK